MHWAAFAVLINLSESLVHYEQRQCLGAADCRSCRSRSLVFLFAAALCRLGSVCMASLLLSSPPCIALPALSLLLNYSTPKLGKKCLNEISANCLLLQLRNNPSEQTAQKRTECFTVKAQSAEIHRNSLICRAWTSRERSVALETMRRGSKKIFYLCILFIYMLLFVIFSIATNIKTAKWWDS